MVEKTLCNWLSMSLSEYVLYWVDWTPVVAMLCLTFSNTSIQVLAAVGVYYPPLLYIAVALWKYLTTNKDEVVQCPFVIQRNQ